MPEITFSIIDTKIGRPLVVYSSSSQDFALVIAVKSQLALSMSTDDIHLQDAVLPFPDVEKISFLFLFKIREKNKESAVTGALSYILDQKDQMFIYQKIPVLLRRAKYFIYCVLGADFQYEGDKTALSSNQEKMFEQLFNDVPIYKSDLDKYVVRNPLKKSDPRWLFSNISKNIDQVLYSLLIEQPIVIMGNKIVVEQTMGILELFVPWKKDMKKLFDINDPIDPAGFDLVGSSNSALIEHYTEIGIVVIDTEKKRIEGGETLKELQQFIDKSIKSRLKSERLDEYITTQMSKYHDYFNDALGLIKENSDDRIFRRFKLRIQHSDVRSIFIAMGKLLYPEYYSYFEKL